MKGWVRQSLRRTGTGLAALGLLVIPLLTTVSAGPLEEAARLSGRPLIARFGLDRCLQCIKQGQAFEVLEPKYRSAMEFRFIHVGELEEMTREYNVLLIPTILFFDANGEEVFRHVGYLTPEQLEAEFAEKGLSASPAGG